MSTLEDEFQRRMRMEEDLRSSLAIDDATTRAIKESFDASRHLRETAERLALVAPRVRELFDNLQMHHLLEQYRGTFSENSGFRAAIEGLRNVETLRSVEYTKNLKHLAEGFGTQTMRDQIAAAAERYRSNFTLPDVSAIAKLSEQISGTKELHLSVTIKAMEAMRAPWLDTRRALESARGFASIQSIGIGAASAPFDTTFTNVLRQQLGDWRGVETFPTSILEDPLARSDFYIERGFDSAIADFPQEAFDEATEAAGLVLNEGYEVDFSGHEKLYAQLLRVEYELREFVHQVMAAAFGEDWPDRDPDLSNRWKETKQRRLDEGRQEQPLLISYSELSDLQAIMQRRDHFHLFKPTFRRVESMQETFRRILPARHAVAHCGVVTQIDVITVLAESVRLRKAIRS